MKFYIFETSWVCRAIKPRLKEKMLDNYKVNKRKKRLTIICSLN